MTAVEEQCDKILDRSHPDLALSTAGPMSTAPNELCKLAEALECSLYAINLLEFN